MSILSKIFTAAPMAEPIQDPELIKKEYKHWRFRIFYSMFIGYAFYYFTRKSLVFAMPTLIQDFGFTKSQLGLLASVFALTYGLSKFVSGMIGDRSNPRYLMPFGLMITGLLNIFFGLSSSLVLFAIFWGLNGWFQGFGWPPCARLLTHWYSQNERGSWWSCWNVSHNVGGFLVPLFIGLCVQWVGWRYAMDLTGLICILVSLLLINRLRDTPQSLGLPSIEKFRDDYSGNGAKATDDGMPLKKMIWEYVIKNKYIWMLAFAYFFVYVVRTGINDWVSLFLQETRKYSALVANGCVSAFEAGGFLGNLAAGWSSDKIFNGKRGPVNVIFSIGVVGALSLFWLSPGILFIDYGCMFLLGFFIFGPQMLIGMAATELSHKKVAATASGFAGWFAYIGAASAGFPLAKISQDYGWEGFFFTIMTCCVVATLLLLPLWSVRSKSMEPRLAKA